MSFLARRAFLKKMGQGMAAAPVLASLATTAAAEKHSSAHAQPSPGSSSAHPAVQLNVRDFGAKGDGQVRDTAAIQQALDRCAALGGGQVLVPAGQYLTGALALRSNTLLRLEKDAVLQGSPDFADYPVTQVRWEGKWVSGHIGLIYAIDASNIGVVGPGRIVGNPALGGRPHRDNPLRHPALIEPIRCTGLRFEGFSTSYEHMWSLHPTCSENIVIRNLTIRSTGGNGDGIDVDSCRHVLIEGCDIATGDDCISLKSGRGSEGYALLRTTEDVVIRNCTFADSIFACIGIGSETSGGIRNVRVEHCKFTHAKTHAVYIKTRPGRGAFIEDMSFRDLDVSGTLAGFLRFNLIGSGLQDEIPVPGDAGIPHVANIHFRGVHVEDCPILVDGLGVDPRKPLEDFSLEDVSGTCKKGIFLANTRRALLRNIRVTGYEGSLKNLIDVTGHGLEGAVPAQSLPTPAPVAALPEPYVLR